MTHNCNKAETREWIDKDSILIILIERTELYHLKVKFASRRLQFGSFLSKTQKKIRLQLRTKKNEGIFKMNVTSSKHQKLQRTATEHLILTLHELHELKSNISKIIIIVMRYIAYDCWNHHLVINELIKIRLFTKLEVTEREGSGKPPWLERTCQSNNDVWNEINLLTAIVRVSVYRAHNVAQLVSNVQFSISLILHVCLNQRQIHAEKLSTHKINSHW